MCSGAADGSIATGIDTGVGFDTSGIGQGIGSAGQFDTTGVGVDTGAGQGIGSSGQFADNLPIAPTAGTSAFDATGATNFTGVDTGLPAAGLAAVGGTGGLGESFGFAGGGSGGGNFDFMATAPTAAATFGGGESAAAGPSLGGLGPGGPAPATGALAPGINLGDAAFSDLSLGISPDQTTNQAGQQFAAVRTDQLYNAPNDALGVGNQGVRGVGTSPDGTVMGGMFGTEPVDNTTPAGVDPNKGGPYINPDLLPIPAGSPGSNLPQGPVAFAQAGGTATDASGGSAEPVDTGASPKPQVLDNNPQILPDGSFRANTSDQTKAGIMMGGDSPVATQGVNRMTGVGSVGQLESAGLSSPNMPGAGSDAGFVSPYQNSPPTAVASQISEGDYTPPRTDTGGDASFASRFEAAPAANIQPSNAIQSSSENLDAQFGGTFAGSGPLSQGTTSPFGPAGSFPSAPLAPSTVGSTSYGEGQFGNQAAMSADEIAQSMANSTGQPLNTQVAGGAPPTSGGFPGAGPATTLPQINVTAANPPPATAPLSGAVGGSAPPLSGGIDIPSLVQPPQFSQPAGPGMMPGAAPSIAAGGDNVGLPGQFGGTLLDQLSRERWMGA